MRSLTYGRKSVAAYLVVPLRGKNLWVRGSEVIFPSAYLPPCSHRPWLAFAFVRNVLSSSLPLFCTLYNYIFELSRINLLDLFVLCHVVFKQGAKSLISALYLILYHYAYAVNAVIYKEIFGRFNDL